MNLTDLTDDDLARIERHAYARGDSTVQALAADALDRGEHLVGQEQIAHALRGTLDRLAEALDALPDVTPEMTEAWRLMGLAQNLAAGL